MGPSLCLIVVAVAVVVVEMMGLVCPHQLRCCVLRCTSAVDPASCPLKILAHTAMIILLSSGCGRGLANWKPRVAAAAAATDAAAAPVCC